MPENKAQKIKNMIGDANNDIQVLYQKLSTNKHVAGLRNTFENNSTVNIELSKAQRYRTIKPGGFFDSLLRPSMQCNLPLMRQCDLN